MKILSILIMVLSSCSTGDIKLTPPPDCADFSEHALKMCVQDKDCANKLDEKILVPEKLKSRAKSWCEDTLTSEEIRTLTGTKDIREFIAAGDKLLTERNLAPTCERFGEHVLKLCLEYPACARVRATADATEVPLEVTTEGFKNEFVRACYAHRLSKSEIECFLKETTYVGLIDKADVAPNGCFGV